MQVRGPDADMIEPGVVVEGMDVDAGRLDEDVVVCGPDVSRSWPDVAMS